MKLDGFSQANIGRYECKAANELGGESKSVIATMKASLISKVSPVDLENKDGQYDVLDCIVTIVDGFVTMKRKSTCGADEGKVHKYNFNVRKSNLSHFHLLVRIYCDEENC